MWMGDHKIKLNAKQGMAKLIGKGSYIIFDIILNFILSLHVYYNIYKAICKSIETISHNLDQ